jgi:hypothetical protein
MFTAAELALQERVRRALDPFGLANPGKVLPPTASDSSTARGVRGDRPQ